MLGEQALQAANNATISVEIEAPPPSVSVTGLAEGSVALAAGTVAVTAGTTYTRTINGVSLQIASTRFTGNVAALNQLFSSANGVFVERAAGESIAIRVVGDISSRGSVSVTAAPVADTVVAGPALTVPAGYALPSGGMILLPAQAVAGAGTLKLQLTVSTGTLAWGASQTLRAAASDTDTIEAGTGNTLTLVGTAADLNAFLSSRDALRFMGSARLRADSAAAKRGRACTGGTGRVGHRCAVDLARARGRCWAPPAAGHCARGNRCNLAGIRP
jgi:hypothetical protein